jgi:hypothetical protein
MASKKSFNQQECGVFRTQPRSPAVVSRCGSRLEGTSHVALQEGRDLEPMQAANLFVAGTAGQKQAIV